MDHTIQYLQHLGAEHIELHLEFSRWILQTNPERGLEIFTAETSEIDSLPQVRFPRLPPSRVWWRGGVVVADGDR